MDTTSASTLTLRPLTRDDVPAWAALLAAAEAVDRTGEHFGEADLHEEMDNPDVTVGEDFVGAWDGDELVGYFSVYGRGEGEGHFKIHVQGVTRPDRRGEGIGSRLVEAMVARAQEVHAARRPDLPARLMATGMTSNTAQADLLERAQMTGERWNFVMRTSLDDLPAPAPLPAGYRIAPVDGDLAVRMLETHNRAFADHPNFTPWTAQTWEHWVTGSASFRPDVSFVVLPDGSDEIVAYLQTAEWEAYFEATGRREAYVGKVGTLREHRGRGLASALLGHALVAYREAGYDEASLDVDSENPTGALGVYRRAGFEVETRWTNYFRTLGR